MVIPTGFGKRLKDERKRLKLSQSQMAEIGGVGRLAQSQYESEQTAPTTRYLSLLGSAGVDLAYLVLGIRPDAKRLSAEQLDSAERQAFEWIEKCAEAEPNIRLSAETRRIMYQLYRNFFIQVALGELPADLAPKLFTSPEIVNSRK